MCSFAKTVEIGPKVRMPILGFGLGMMAEKDVYPSLDWALKAGYRLFDTAQMYKNEEFIGKSLKELLPKHKLQRGEIFITTKLDRDSLGQPYMREKLLESLSKFQMDFVDLFLIHYPKKWSLDDKDPKNIYLRKLAWLEMEKFQGEGLCKAIGVSNYEVRHLKEIELFGSIQPAVNQCEFHPQMTRQDLLAHCQKAGIHFQAFVSLGRNNPELVNQPLLIEIANKHNATVQQILLAWAMCQGVSVLPKSTNEQRIKLNFGALRVELSKEEIEQISGLEPKDGTKQYSQSTPWDVI